MAVNKDSTVKKYTIANRQAVGANSSDDSEHQMDVSLKQIGQRVKKRRDLFGLTLEELAKKDAGVLTASWISAVENAKIKHPSEQKIKALATSLEMHPDELLRQFREVEILVLSSPKASEDNRIPTVPVVPPFIIDKKLGKPWHPLEDKPRIKKAYLELARGFESLGKQLAMELPAIDECMESLQQAASLFAYLGKEDELRAVNYWIGRSYQTWVRVHNGDTAISTEERLQYLHYALSLLSSRSIPTKIMDYPNQETFEHLPEVFTRTVTLGAYARATSANIIRRIQLELETLEVKSEEVKSEEDNSLGSLRRHTTISTIKWCREEAKKEYTRILKYAPDESVRPSKSVDNLAGRLNKLIVMHYDAVNRLGSIRDLDLLGEPTDQVELQEAIYRLQHITQSLVKTTHDLMDLAIHKYEHEKGETLRSESRHALAKAHEELGRAFYLMLKLRKKNPGDAELLHDIWGLASQSLWHIRASQKLDSLGGRYTFGEYNRVSEAEELDKFLEANPNMGDVHEAVQSSIDQIDWKKLTEGNSSYNIIRELTSIHEGISKGFQ